VGDRDRGGGQALAAAVELAAELGQLLVVPQLVAGDGEGVADVEVVDGQLELAGAEQLAVLAVGGAVAVEVGVEGGDGLGEQLEAEEGGDAAVDDEGCADADGRGAGDRVLVAVHELVDEEHRRAVREEVLEGRVDHAGDLAGA